MDIFLINLDRNEDRLKRMVGLISGMRLQFSRLNAIDGKSLGDDEFSQWTEKRPDGEYCLSPSEVGCMMSHREAWKKVAKKSSGHAVILEDDLHFSSAAAQFLSDDSWIPEDADIVKIETVFWLTLVGRKTTRLDAEHTLARLYGQHFGMAGYIITPNTAQKLLNIGKTDRAIDQILFDPNSDIFHTLKIYQINPALCAQDQFLPSSNSIGIPTDIERGWQLARRPKSRGEKIRREIRRFINQTSNRLRGTIFSRLNGKLLTKIKFTAAPLS